MAFLMDGKASASWPLRRRLQQQRGLCRRGHLQLRRAGLAFHGEGLPDALDLRVPVEGSTLDDWPIGYQDLEPYYEKAEWELGVSGDVSANIFKAPRQKPLPMPPLSPNREYRILQPAAKRLGLHPFDIPMLRNTVPYNGRGPCMRCRWCVGFACEVNARTGTHNTVIPKALATGNCELRAECMVKEVLLDDRGRAKGVAYFDAADRLQVQTADVVIVSGAAIESARLLLNSKSKLFPNGLGNRYDWVGRNLQSHTYSGAVGLFDFDTYDDVGPGAQIAVCDYNHGNPGLTAAPCWPTSSSGCPINSSGKCPVRSPMGRGAQGVGPQRVQADDSVQGADPGDALVRCARSGGPEGQGLLGHSRGPPLGRQAPALDRGRQVHDHQGGGLAEGSRRHSNLEETAWRRFERRAASGGNLPHGERPEDLGGRQVLPGSRCRQRLCHRRQRARYERRLQPGADDHGRRLLCLRQPHQGAERSAGGRA